MQIGIGMGIGFGITVNPYDAAAQTFFDAVAAAGGTISAPSKAAYDDFVSDGKANGWWDHIEYLLPMIGDYTASKVAHALGLGSATGATFDNFVEADYTEATGFTGNGTNKKINLGFAPPVPTGGLSAYVRGAQGGTAAVAFMGAQNATDQYRIGRAGTNSDSDDARYGKTTQSLIVVAGRTGHFHGFRGAADALKHWRNGAQIGATVVTATDAAAIIYNLFVFCQNNVGSAANFMGATIPISFVSVDDGLMTDAEANAFGAAVVAMQTSLARNA